MKLRNNPSAASLIGFLTLASVGLAACGNKETDPRSRGNAPSGGDSFDVRCLDTLNADLDASLKGLAANADAARRPFKCAAGALGLFASRTRGANPQHYTAGELRVFAQKYLPDAAVTEAQISGVLAIKHALLGGGESVLRVDQLERVKSFLNFVGDEMVMLQGYLREGTTWPLIQVRETWALAAARWQDRWGAGLQALRISALSVFLTEAQLAQVTRLKTLVWGGEAETLSADELRRTLQGAPDLAAAVVGVAGDAPWLQKLPAVRYGVYGWRAVRGVERGRLPPEEIACLRQLLGETENTDERSRNAWLWLAARLLLEPLRDGGWHVGRVVQLVEAFADQPAVLEQVQTWANAGMRAPVPFTALLAVGTPVARLWEDRSGFSEPFVTALFAELTEFSPAVTERLTPFRSVLLTVPRGVKRWARAQGYLEDAYSREGILPSTDLAYGLRGLNDEDLARWMTDMPLHVVEGRGTVSFAATARREARRTYYDASMAAFAREFPGSLLTGAEGGRALADLADIYTFSANGNQRAEDWEMRELIIQLLSARELAGLMLTEFRSRGCAPADREEFSRACVERTFMQDSTTFIRLLARTFPRWNEERADWTDWQSGRFLEFVGQHLFARAEGAAAGDLYPLANLERLTLLLHMVESWIVYSDADGDGWLIGESENFHIFPFLLERMRAVAPGACDGNGCLYSVWGYMVRNGIPPTAGAMVGWRVSWSMRGAFHIYLEMNRLRALGLMTTLIR